MGPEAISQYITETFDGLDVVVANGDSFFFYDPERSLPPERRLPFATIVTSDAYDQVSDLNRPGVYRLNFGVSRDTFQTTVGSAGSGDAGGGVDYTALDRIMPHPVYGTMFWLCVLNPSVETFEAVKPLLAEAHERARGQHARLRRGAEGGPPPR